MAFWWCVNMLPLASFCVRLSTVPPSRATTQHVTFVPSKYALVSCPQQAQPWDVCVAGHRKPTPVISGKASMQWAPHALGAQQLTGTIARTEQHGAASPVRTGVCSGRTVMQACEKSARTCTPVW